MTEPITYKVVPIDVVENLWEKVSIENGYGSSFYIYRPKEYDKNTPVILLEHGGGLLSLASNDNRELNLALLNENVPAIVICYDRADANNLYTYNSETIEKRFSMLNLTTYLNEEFGITTDNLNLVGFSSGFTETLWDAAEIRKWNPDIPSQFVFILDGYTDDKYPNKYTTRAYEAMKILGEGGDIIFAIHTPDIAQSTTFYENSTREYNANIILIEDYRVNEEGSSIVDHVGIYKSYITNQLYLFNLGISPFPKEGYIAKRYIQTTDNNGETIWQWVEVDIGGMTKYEVYEMFGIETYELYQARIEHLKKLQDLPYYVASDPHVLSGHLNNIIGCIRNSNFVESPPNFSASFTSTTSVPSQIPSIVSQFFSSNSQFLTILASDINTIYEMGDSIEKINLRLALLAENLNIPNIEPTQPNNNYVTEEGGTVSTETLDNNDGDYIIF